MTSVGRLRIKLQIVSGGDWAIGPGKADLLEAIIREGSISGAGRAMGMSYRRTWLLVDAMNRCWKEPLVETIAGGGRERGARLTACGVHVLKTYRALEKNVSDAANGDPLAELIKLVRDEPLASQRG